MNRFTFLNGRALRENLIAYDGHRFYDGHTMSTASVRKFVISVDPDEPLDFAEPLEFFQDALGGIGFEQVGTYVFRYNDQECMLKIQLSDSSDGFYVNAYVQAPDEHRYRLEEVGAALAGYIVE